MPPQNPILAFAFPRHHALGIRAVHRPRFTVHCPPPHRPPSRAVIPSGARLGPHASGVSEAEGSAVVFLPPLVEARLSNNATGIHPQPPKPLPMIRGFSPVKLP